MPESKDQRVAVRVEIPKSLDREVELEVVKRDTTKRQFVEDALRAHLKASTKRTAA